jgi:hypothetical protein
MALVRGSGRGGLSGIRPLSEGLFVRPLLETSREEILAYLDERGIPFRVDASNADRRFPRNRVRHDLLPLLRASLNPRVAEAIARTADLLREEDAYLERRARRALERLSCTTIRPFRRSFSSLLPLPPRSRSAASALVRAASRSKPIASPRLPARSRAASRASRCARGARGARSLARARSTKSLALAARGENRALLAGRGHHRAP